MTTANPRAVPDCPRSIGRIFEIVKNLCGTGRIEKDGNKIRGILNLPAKVLEIAQTERDECDEPNCGLARKRTVLNFCGELFRAELTCGSKHISA